MENIYDFGGALWLTAIVSFFFWLATIVMAAIPNFSDKLIVLVPTLCIYVPVVITWKKFVIKYKQLAEDTYKEHSCNSEITPIE